MARNINDVCNELRPYISRYRLKAFNEMTCSFIWKAPEQSYECFAELRHFLISTFGYPPRTENGWRCAEIFTTKTREQLLKEHSA